MSALQEEIREAVAPLLGEIKVLQCKVEQLEKGLQKPLLSFKEVAEELGVSTRTIRNHAKEGRFEIVEMGGSRYIRRESI